MTTHFTETRFGKFVRAFDNANLASLRILAKSGGGQFREYLRTTERQATAATMAPIQVVDMCQLCNADTVNLYLPLQHIRIGASPFADIVALSALVKRHQPHRVFELGTFEGAVTCALAKNAAPNARVFTLDLPHEVEIERTERSYEAHSIKMDYESGKYIRVLGCSDQVERLFGDSAIFDFSPFYDSIDFFFVDGAHTEDYVNSDTKRALECVRDGGVIAWHDCLLPQIIAFLHELARHLPLQYIRETNVAFVELKKTQAVRDLIQELPFAR